jgi:hypothetical protein
LSIYFHDSVTLALLDFQSLFSFRALFISVTLRRFNTDRLSKLRLIYVDRIWANRTAADTGMPYKLEVWSDETYVHHHHHSEFGWLGEDPEDMFPGFQYKGAQCVATLLTAVNLG